MGTDLFFKGREDGWLQYTKYRGVKVKPNFEMQQTAYGLVCSLGFTKSFQETWF